MPLRRARRINRAFSFTSINTLPRPGVAFSVFFIRVGEKSVLSLFFRPIDLRKVQTDLHLNLRHSSLGPSAAVELLVLPNLRGCKVRHVLAFVPRTIPVDGPFQGGFDLQPRFPAEFGAGFAGVES